MPCQSLVLKLQAGDSKQVVHQNYLEMYSICISGLIIETEFVFLGCIQHLCFKELSRNTDLQLGFRPTGAGNLYL